VTGQPDWNITGSEVKVTVEGYGTIKNSAFRVRGLPIIYIPYMIFPAKAKRQTGLLPPRVGYSTLNGGELEIPFSGPYPIKPMLPSIRAI